LLHAQRAIPLYRNLWSSHGVDVRDLNLPADLHRLPVLTKQHLRAAGVEARLDPRFTRARLASSSTSGSTGEPMTLLLDKASRRRRQARFLRALLAAGYRPGQRLMLVSSRAEHSIRKVSPWARLLRWHYVDLYEGTAALLQAYERIRPHVLYAPLHALLLLGDALRASSCRHRPAHVVSTSEQLLPSAQRHLTELFGTSVTDFYGLTEVGLVAWRLAGTARYEVVSNSFLLEFLPHSAEPRGFDRLLITELRGGAMPLYRYDSGDLVRRRTPQEDAIVEIAGKQLDFLQLPDGEQISPYLVDRILGEMPGVSAYRVVQQPDLALEVSAVTSDPAVLERARAALQTLCRGQLPLTLLRLDALAVTGHKARPIQSLAARHT
jgi:phenylacetate-CoA ligase